MTIPVREDDENGRTPTNLSQQHIHFRRNVNNLDSGEKYVNVVDENVVLFIFATLELLSSLSFDFAGTLNKTDRTDN